MVTIIGRGHSGTRAISHTLSQAGVFMGEPLNVAGDLLPPDAMYEACRVMARNVRHLDGLRWDFSALHDMPIPDEFTRLMETYLKSVLESKSEHRGWKIPETTLVYPWIKRMFPEMKYIFWVRNPRDCIIGAHLTDDMARFGINYPPTEDPREQRAFSWFYQYEIMRAVPRPANSIQIRFEDFVLRQDETLKKLESFLGIPLPRIPVRPDSLDRWKNDEAKNYFPFFAPAMKEHSYDIPEIGGETK